MTSDLSRSIVLAQHAINQAQEFAHRPRLKRAAARRVRRVGVRDLRNVAETGFVEMPEQRSDESLPGRPFRFRRMPAHADPGFDKWADQPRPNGSFMIRSVALEDAALIAG